MSTGVREYGCILVTLLFTCALHAQVERGTISGTVRDPSGGVVPNAPVTVKNVNTGVAESTVTNQGGEYVAPNLIPGEYSVTVAQPGFNTITLSGIVLHVDERVAVNVPLTVGAVTQNLE